jgi:hypothetical protein
MADADRRRRVFALTRIGDEPSMPALRGLFAKGDAVSILKIVALSLFVFVHGLTPAAAQAQDRAPAQVQKEYDVFIAGFRAALKANDRAAVTAMTRFPFYWNEMKDAVYFEKNLYGKVFTPKVRNCLARARGYYTRDPQGTDTFTHICGESLFLFSRTPEGFRFIEEGVND